MLATSNSVTQIANFDAKPDSRILGLKLWAVLAFQAGWINGGGFVACHRFVTHTTGFATQFGFDLASAKWGDAAAMLSIPLFFLCGAMIAAYFVEIPLQMNKKPKFHVLFFLISVFLITATVFGNMSAFGSFGSEPQSWPAYILIALLCVSSGIQNAFSTTASKNYVRTTHLTGYTTDLGISFIRLLSLKDTEKVQQELEQNKIRGTVIFMFIFGTACSSFLFVRKGYVGFIFPALISAVLFFIAKREYGTHG